MLGTSISNIENRIRLRQPMAVYSYFENTYDDAQHVSG